MVEGLLTCKPENSPSEGDAITLTVEQKPTKKDPSKFWNKLRRDKEGDPYIVKEARQTDFTDDHGNISFNLKVEPQGAPQANGDGPAPARSFDDRGEQINRSVAFKGAVDLLAASDFDTAGATPQLVQARVGELTEALLPVVTGGSGVGGGESVPNRDTPERGAAADSSAPDGKASDAQLGWLYGGVGKGPGLFQKAGLSEVETQQIVKWCGDPLSAKAATALIEKLKDDSTEGGRDLLAKLRAAAEDGDEKAKAALGPVSDVPADTSDFEPVPNDAPDPDDLPPF